MTIKEVITKSGKTVQILRGPLLNSGDLRDLQRNAHTFHAAVGNTKKEQVVYFGRGERDEFVEAIQKDARGLRNIKTGEMSAQGMIGLVWMLTMENDASTDRMNLLESAKTILGQVNPRLLQEFVTVDIEAMQFPHSYDRGTGTLHEGGRVLI